MFALRATVHARSDVLVQPLLLRRLSEHRSLRIDDHSFLALIPRVGSAIVARTIGQFTVDVVLERSELAPLVIDALEAELRRDGVGDRVAIAWSTPDRVPVPLR